MKRIAFTVSNDLNYDQRMQRICATLQETGYDVTLIGRQRKASKPLVDQSFRQIRLKLFFEKGKLFYLELNMRLFFYLLRHEFEVVCGIDLDTILPCWFAARLKKKTCVYDAHELFTEVPEVLQRKTVRSVWLRVEKFVFARVKYIYTVSESVAQEFARRYGIKPAVIRNLPNRHKTQDTRSKTVLGMENGEWGMENAFHFQFSIFNFQLIYRGAVNAGRGIEQMIDAMVMLPDTNLLIAGDGDVLDRVKQKVDELKLNNRVAFTGYATPDELNRYTERACLGLNLLDGASANYRYSLANKFFDYIQCGVPQLCMNFPEYARVNDQYDVAVLLDDLQPHAIAGAVQNLWNDEARYKELKLNCAEAAADLCWENERAALLDFYRLIP